MGAVVFVSRARDGIGSSAGAAYRPSRYCQPPLRNRIDIFFFFLSFEIVGCEGGNGGGGLCGCGDSGR